ncbi:MAG: hypothetical protein HY885_04055 [Deltaproteobacteria bacterium]|nr:hypothetical protein [Deltaproteobacteria bacterium]
MKRKKMTDGRMSPAKQHSAFLGAITILSCRDCDNLPYFQLLNPAVRKSIKLMGQK